MSLWFLEGFDHYNNNTYGNPITFSTLNEVLRKWTGQASIALAEGSTGQGVSPSWARQQPGQGWRWNNANNAVYLYKNRPGPVTDTIIVGVAFMLDTGHLGALALVAFLDGTTEQVSVRGDGSGHITFTRNGTVLATSVNSLALNTWYYVEMKAKIHNTTGTYEVRINGTSSGWIPPATGANTRNTANNQATAVSVHAGAIGLRLDDLYAADTLGSVNNDFLGPQMIQTIRPVAPGNYAQFVPNFGANFANVNEILPDYDLSFNADTVAGHRDSHVFQDIPMVSGTVTGLQHVLVAKQDAGATRTLAPFQRSGGADYDVTGSPLTTSYVDYLTVYDVDPATSSPYTINNLNAAEFGYRLVS